MARRLHRRRLTATVRVLEADLKEIIEVVDQNDWLKSMFLLGQMREALRLHRLELEGDQ